MRRSRFHTSEPEPHGNGWVSQSERIGAQRRFLVRQEDTDGYTVPGTAQRFDYARDALAYVQSRKHEPQPVAEPRPASDVRERIRVLMEKLP